MFGHKLSSTASLVFCLFQILNQVKAVRVISMRFILKVAWYSFSGSISPKFEHKLHCHKQSFGKIATTVVLDKGENLLWSGLQWHQSCHSNEVSLLPILLAAVYLGTGNCSSKIFMGAFSSNIVASMFLKFKRNLWERYQDILR